MFDSIPDSIILEIFTYLPLPELIVSTKVDKRFNRIASSNELWKPFALSFIEEYRQIPSINEMYFLFKCSDCLKKLKLKWEKKVQNFGINKPVVNDNIIYKEIIYEIFKKALSYKKQNKLRQVKRVIRPGGFFSKYDKIINELHEFPTTNLEKFLTYLILLWVFLTIISLLAIIPNEDDSPKMEDNNVWLYWYNRANIITAVLGIIRAILNSNDIKQKLLTLNKITECTENDHQLVLTPTNEAPQVLP